MNNRVGALKSILISFVFAFMSSLIMVGFTFVVYMIAYDTDAEYIVEEQSGIGDSIVMILPLFITAITQFIFGIIAAKITKHTLSITIGTIGLAPLIVVVSIVVMSIMVADVVDNASATDAVGWLALVLVMVSVLLLASIPVLIISGTVGSAVYSLTHKNEMTPLFIRSKQTNQYYNNGYGYGYNQYQNQNQNIVNINKGNVNLNKGNINLNKGNQLNNNSLR